MLLDNPSFMSRHFYLALNQITKFTKYLVEAGLPGENPRVQAGDHHIQPLFGDHGDRSLLAAVINEWIVHCATWTP